MARLSRGTHCRNGHETSQLCSIHSRWFVLELVTNLRRPNIQFRFFFFPCILLYWGYIMPKAVLTRKLFKLCCRNFNQAKPIQTPEESGKLRHSKVGRPHIPDQTVSGVVVPPRDWERISVDTKHPPPAAAIMSPSSRDQDRSSFNNTHTEDLQHNTNQHVQTLLSTYFQSV